MGMQAFAAGELFRARVGAVAVFRVGFLVRTFFRGHVRSLLGRDGFSLRCFRKPGSGTGTDLDLTGVIGPERLHPEK